MFSVWRRARLTWITVGCLAACGLASIASLPAVAQTTSAPSEAQARLDEIQIEMAWDADPRIFPYHLVAAREGTVLKVYGIVPPNVAPQVLKTAQANTSLSVMAMLQLRPSLSSHARPESPVALQKAVVRLLTEAFPTQVRNLDVKADASGRVIVGGVLPSHEERRTVNRRLREIHGCTAVVNQVRVPAVVSRGQQVVPVTADGDLELPLSAPAPTDSPYAPVATAGIQQAAFTQPGPASPPVLAAMAQVPSAARDTENGPPAPNDPISPTKLKRQIERACGMAVRQVQVTGAPGGGLNVHLKARSEEEGHRLLDKLMTLPELAPYQVRFQIQVEH
jgi:hypothetical protein